MNRAEILRNIADHSKPWHMIVTGGGATGVGIAIDAASRGYEVLLLEQSDFGKGTSSRSTKLIHGGIRYLRQGNLKLVTEALQERALLLQNAPHIVHDLAFVIPYYKRWDASLYGSGIKLYQWLARKYGCGNSQISSTRLTEAETIDRIPNLNRGGLRGGSVYYDGQFDDSRLLIHMVMTAAKQGATLLNYAEVVDLCKDSQGRVNGVLVRDVETGNELRAFASVVINATGAFCDRVRQFAVGQSANRSLENSPRAAPAQPKMIAPSQGIHLVFSGPFLNGSSAMLIPRTADGRVLFAIPWYGHTLVGTTETPVSTASLEPVALDHEIDLILSTTARYLAKAPTRDDVLSVFAGIRPLVRAAGVSNTAVLSRDHIVQIDRSRLLTICGGKWTTYRRMAQDCVDQAAKLAGLPQRACRTRDLPIHGHQVANLAGPLLVHGADVEEIKKLIYADSKLAEPLHSDLHYIKAEVVWAVRSEMARTIDDVLARRTRALFLDARAAIEAALDVSKLMARELGWTEATRERHLAEFRSLARNYSLHRS
jgi:glycerol-3-phosphate dehydrogenase